MDDRLVNVFREVFDDPGLEIADATSAKDIPEWDSLAQVKLIIGIEGEFGIKFTTNEVADLTCVGDLKRALGGKGVR